VSVRQNIATGARKVLLSAERLRKTVAQKKKKVLGKVSPSHETTRLPLGISFVEVYSGTFSNTSTTFRFSSNIIIITSHEDQQNFITPHRIFLGFKILHITAEKKISLLSDIFFFRKSCHLLTKNKKYGRSTKAKKKKLPVI